MFSLDVKRVVSVPMCSYNTEQFETREREGLLLLWQSGVTLSK